MRVNGTDTSRVTRTPFIPGSVCWAGVSGADPAVDREFYSRLFGWTYQVDERPGGAVYITAWCGGRPVASLSGDPVAPGARAAWTPYLASANVMRTAQRLHAWGGRVLAGPMDVPGQGRALIGVEPTGAVTGFWQPARPWMFGRIGVGSLYWAELDTWNGAEADAFFADLFGYRQRQIGDGVDVDYTIWFRDGQPMLGRLQMNQDWADPASAAHWMLHFAVDPRSGTDAAAHRVVALGGRVLIEPYDTELGRIARVADPAGAAFALIDPTDRVDPVADLAAGAARVDDPYDD